MAKASRSSIAAALPLLELLTWDVPPLCCWQGSFLHPCNAEAGSLFGMFVPESTIAGCFQAESVVLNTVAH